MIHILERLLNKKERKHPKFLNRKLSIHPKQYEQTYFNLYGAPKVGKTAWAKLFATAFNAPLLIDCADPRITPHITHIATSLHMFIKEQAIDLLILDGMTIESLNLFDLEMMSQSSTVLILSEEALLKHDAYALKGIDFEEYMSFSHTKNPEQLFNAFLLDGTLPEIFFTEPNKKNQRKREILLLCHRHKPDLLLWLLSFMGQAITPHHLYTQLKKTIPTSKDTLYHMIKQYEKQSMIYWLPKLNAPHAAKKLYFWDFSLFNAISYDRNFVALFENMIFLEIIHTACEIYYSDTLDFLIQKDHDRVGIIAAPFLSLPSIKKRMQKAQQEALGLTHIFVITLNHTQAQKEGTIPYTILPFWEFALGEYE